MNRRDLVLARVAATPPSGAVGRRAMDWRMGVGGSPTIDQLLAVERLAAADLVPAGPNGQLMSWGFASL